MKKISKMKRKVILKKQRKKRKVFTTELAKYPSSESLTTDLEAVLPSTEAYRYDFASPIWYPCASGIVILIAAILFIWTICRIIFWIVTSIALFLLNRGAK